jgi:addiction module RelE/StbE family toxin
MTKSYVFKWTAPAVRDLFEICEYIAHDSKTKANKISNEINKKVSSLSQFPMRGRVVPELADFGYTQYREIIHKPWRIIYKVVMDTVYIMVVIDSRRNVGDIILKMLTR